MLTDEYLAEVRARHENTYEGPWIAHQGADGWNYITARSVTVARYISDINVRFIVHAYKDIPLLLAEIAELRQQLIYQGQNVVVLRKMCEKAFLAGAQWAVKGLPLSMAENVVRDAHITWLEEEVGERQSVAVQSGDTPDIRGYDGDG